ncbi:MAG: hypothetical protein DA408_02055 [Bacteroidetes bacterium]|nr:MAG: hypothetical protein C7N36_09685 [Bacteroidota bacterium]PTM14823.1 MAG: hypothetical protein DA408_02055 [Bacteroidota bacterium]
MTQTTHRIYIGTLVSIVVLVFFYLLFHGLSYYNTSLEERFYHPNHDWFKPSGAMGHGLGIAGTLLILIGVFGYRAKKRYRWLARFGRLKYWLEFHIFLCSLGPVLILFHTAFKFGGIVSVSFWSMIVVVASGIVGRFIYVQIPRTIEGRELSLAELQQMKNQLSMSLAGVGGVAASNYQDLLTRAQVKAPQEGNLLSRIIRKYGVDRATVQELKVTLQQHQTPRPKIREATYLLRKELSLDNRIERLHVMQKLFKYWHVAHLPFALIMLFILVIHVAITLAFGYRWIF